MKRHYRSVAYLCILGLIFTAIGAAVVATKAGLNLAVLVMGTDAVLLLVTIIFVYKSKAPWADPAAKTLIWIVFGIALFLNLALPLVMSRRLNFPALVIYVLIFPYLFWLNGVAAKCTASR